MGLECDRDRLNEPQESTDSFVDGGSRFRVSHVVNGRP